MTTLFEDGVIISTPQDQPPHAKEFEPDSHQSAENKDPADPTLWLYRERTVTLLRRYMKLSLQVGRVPALLGRELISSRTRVSPYGSTTLENTVIFVHDIERCLEQLSEFEKNLIAVIVLQDHSQFDAARILNYSRRYVVDKFPEALDHVSALFLERGILLPFPGSG